MGHLSTVGTLLIFLAVFAVGSLALGFFKAAIQQRKSNKEVAKQQAEIEQAEKELAEEKKKAKKKAMNKDQNKPKVKRLGE